jgi:phosphate transport system protein
VTHLEQSLQSDIDRITCKFSEMATLVERALQSCVKVLEENNRQLAYSVILRDQRIDELEKELDRLILEFIVRQQPVARHLRFAYSAIKVNAQLERVGDYAESIARQFLTLSSMEVPIPSELYRPIADLAIPMIRDAVKAFTKQDPELAKVSMAQEDTVDQLRHTSSRELLSLNASGKFPSEGLAPLQNILNRFERVADQAKNINQDVLYLCTGEYVKHFGSEAYRVLFVDDDNASLGQMAEAIGQSFEQPKFIFSTAGIERASVDLATMTFLRLKGLDTSRLAAKSLDQIPYRDHYQIVIALSRRAQQAFPPPPTKVVCLDWSGAVVGDGGEPGQHLQETFEQNYQFLFAHLKDLVEAVLCDEPG